MKTKLVSLNIGIQLTVLQDGKEHKMSYACLLPSKSFKDVMQVVSAVCDYLNDELGSELWIDGTEKVSIVKPTIKAPAPAVSQEEFNKKIKEIVP